MKSEYVAVVVDGVLQDAECYRAADGTVSGYDWETGQWLGNIAPGKKVQVFPVPPGKKPVIINGKVVEVE